MRVLSSFIGIFSLIVFPAFAGPYDPQLAPQIDTYLTGKNSPIAGNGAVFFSSGSIYNVDPRLVVAIAGAESSFGTAWDACPETGFNAWSWFYGGSCPNSSLISFADGISKVTSGIRRLYLNKGYTTIPQIAEMYCGSGCESWIPNVTQFYTDLGGNVNDLTFPPPSRFILQPGPDTGKDIWITSVYSYATCSGSYPGGGLYDSELRVGGWGDLYYALLQFDLTGLPAHATSATLWLYCYSDNSGTPTPMYLDRVTQFWWDWQMTGTGCDHDRLWWADRPSTAQWSAAALTAPVVGQWYTVDITDLYNAWQNGLYPNYGLQLRPVYNADNFNFFYSSRYTNDTFRPKLTIQQ